jgi:hypothetical protein
MKKTVILFVILVMVFAFTIPASAGDIGPGAGNGRGAIPTDVPEASGIGNGSEGRGFSNSQGQQGPRINFAINGEIVAIGTDTVTITVTCGNNTAQPYIGSDVTVTVTPLTHYNIEVDTTDTPILFSELLVGQLVSLNGTVVNSVWTVRRVTVVTALDCDALP